MAPSVCADRCQDGVRALVQGLDHHVAGIVDIVDVVAAPPACVVGAAAAVEDVGAGIAGQHVVQAVAGPVEVGRPGQRQVLDVGAQRMR